MDTDLAIISSIDFDHTSLLGNTLEAIAFEKAGIMRSSKPCIWGQSIVPDNVQAYAEKLDAPLKVYEKDFGIQAHKTNTWNWWNTYRSLVNLPIPSLSYLAMQRVCYKH